MAFAQASTKKRKSSNNYAILQPNNSQSSDPLAARQPRKGKRTNPLASLLFFLVGTALFRTLIWTIHLASDWEGVSNNKYYSDSGTGGDYNNNKIALFTNAGAAADTTKQYNNINYTDFSYNLNSWHTPPCIVILAGPHKAASTTLQKFVSKLAGATTSLMRDHPGYDDSLFQRQPHESFRNSWVWPLPVPPEMAQITNGPYGKDSYGIAFANSSSKFYTSLAAFATQRALSTMYTGWKNVQGNPIEEQDYHKRVSQIYKRLLHTAWTTKPHNRGIVFGSELFDAVIDGIYDTTNNRHEVPEATSRINRLLQVLPFGTHRSTGMPLQETDIEIHIHYRTPRVDHLVSWWHQHSQNNQTFRELMLREGQFRQYGHITNSLALALQFVQRGLKTTIVDMEGVRQMDTRFPPPKHTKSHVHIAGLQGVLVCEILRMSELCTTDEKRRNYVALPFEGTTRKERQGLTQAANQREDTSIKNLTSTQLEAMEVAYQHYDCGVWRHLQPFLQKGLLRILHPSENLFATCEQQQRQEMTFRDLWLELSAIAAQ